METRTLGAFGEEQAVRCLRRKGYRIVERNFRCRQGEIDVIARKRDVLAFVEVKLRKDERFAEAREFVTRAKQERILTAAQLYLARHAELQELQPRFDVIEVYAPQGEDGPVRVEHIENAFD